MSPLISALLIVASFVTGGLVIYFARELIGGKRFRSAEREAQRLLTEARDKAKEALLEAKEEAIKAKASAEAEMRERRIEVQRQERRISQKDENLDRRGEALERREKSIAAKEKECDGIREQLLGLKQKEIKQMELISGMSSAEAKQFLLDSIETEVREDASRRVRKIEAELKDKADEMSREILSLAIQRCATDVVSETTVSVVPLPSDEMKGRLIGREGRNIRALEAATGVELIIDDTPEAVTLSCFDPVRRETARVALNRLITDGRIHPGRIEEIVQKARAEVEAQIRVEGERAAYETGVQGLNPELVRLLGRLKYRYSYGQNVLAHSIEVALLSGMIATELGYSADLAKRAGLLHDIGKAVDHEVEGTHAAIGANLVKQWEKSPEVTQAISEHHGESGTTSLLGFIVSTSDAISGGRPGARRESLEHYVKRLEALESVANSFKGVEKSFAIQAGREVRILVKPDEVDDLSAVRLARDIVKKIEETLQYPGQVKVTVIRETRAVEYAK